MPDRIDPQSGPSKIEAHFHATPAPLPEMKECHHSECQDLATQRFNQINADYSHARVIYTDTEMKGRGSKKLEGLPCILWDLKAFMKWVKAEAERVAFEVQVLRPQEKYNKNYWATIKDAFKAELERLRNK